MSIIAAVTEKQKTEVIQAANACGLSQSAFIKLCVTDYIRQMKEQGKIPK